MKPGKLASQACHAAKGCVLKAKEQDPDRLTVYQGPDNIGTQVVLEAPNQLKILEAYQKAKEAGLIAYLVIDQHHVIPGTLFTGDPIITGLGIGPCTKEEAKSITKKFRVVQ
jgi:peptidyl-tRNA hydrolase